MRSSDLVASQLEMLVLRWRRVYFVDAAVDATFMCAIVDFFARERNERPLWIRTAFLRPTNRAAEIVTAGASLECEAPGSPRDRVWLEALQAVVARVERGERVVVVSSSVKFTEQAAELLKARAGVKVAVYNSERDAVDFAGVNVAWLRYDVVVYSPTVSAGVSFMPRDPATKEPIAHFDSLVAFLINGPGVPSASICLQMLWRVRVLSKGEMQIFVDERRGELDLACTLAQVHGALQNKARCDLSLCCAATRRMHVDTRRTPDRKFEYDPARMSYHVAAGIIATENRSARLFTAILERALEEDYGVRVTKRSAAPSKEDVDEIVGAMQAVAAEPGIAWSDITVFACARDAATARRLADPAPAQRASMRLHTYFAGMWGVSAHLVDEEFYRDFVEAGDARERYYMARRWADFVAKSREENERAWLEEAEAMRESRDRNMVFLKTLGKRARHASLLINAQAVLEATLTGEQLEAFKAFESVTVSIDALLAAVKRREQALSPAARKLFRESFGLERSAKKPDSSALNTAKQLLARPFSPTVSRSDSRNKTCSTIVIECAWLKEVTRKYRPEILRRR
jgi:hypothetical protein